MISSAPEIEELARSVDDNGGAYFVPAFSGLFAPYWRSDARGVFCGLTRFINHGHIARATLDEAERVAVELAHVAQHAPALRPLGNGDGDHD